MKFTIQLPNYDPDKGVQHVWEENAEISTQIENGEILINANPAGLRSLANFLLYLSQEGVPDGSHMHLDESNGLETSSAELIISKNEKP